MMSREIVGNVNLRWFDAYPMCRCGKPARGILMGVGNASYGPRCESCADKELKAADKARAETTVTAARPYPPQSCKTCGGTGKESRHQLCRDCD